MESIIISFVDQFGYWGVLLLIAIENIFPPIPSEVILTFGGFMTTYTNMTILGVTIFSTIGSILGAIVLYGVGRLLNKERLEKIISSKAGRILCLKKKDIEKADYWFDTKGAKTVFICRFIPIVRSLISIPAGMTNMPFLKFISLTFLGTCIWNVILISLGAKLGSSWTLIVDFMNKYSVITLIVIIVVLIVVIGLFYKKRLKERKKNNK